MDLSPNWKPKPIREDWFEQTHANMNWIYSRPLVTRGKFQIDAEEPEWAFPVRSKSKLSMTDVSFSSSDTEPLDLQPLQSPEAASPSPSAPRLSPVPYVDVLPEEEENVTGRSRSREAVRAGLSATVIQAAIRGHLVQKKVLERLGPAYAGAKLQLAKEAVSRNRGVTVQIPHEPEDDEPSVDIKYARSLYTSRSRRR